MVSVFLADAVFSIIENGWPGYTKVPFMNDDPRSKPISWPEALESVVSETSAMTARDSVDILPSIFLVHTV